MKVVFIIFSSLLFFSASAQNLDSLGIDNNFYVNNAEANYLNNNLQGERGNFDFHEKKILFANGNNAIYIQTKVNYFEDIKPWLSKKDTVVNYLLRFTEEERQAANNFDGVVVSWTKYTVTAKRKAEIIRQLNKGLPEFTYPVSPDKNVKIKFYNKTGYNIDSLSFGGTFIGKLEKDSATTFVYLESFMSDENPTGYIDTFSLIDANTFRHCGTGVELITRGAYEYDLLLLDHGKGLCMIKGQHK